MSRRARIGIFLPSLAGLGALLVWAYTGIPAFGNYRGPYGFVLERIATPLRHMDNVVNATTYDIRGFDTLGEEFILFAAVIGVVLLLRDQEGREEEKKEVDDDIGSDLVRVFGVVGLGAAMLVGLWLVAFGFVTPGGGFQGGVAIGSAALLLYLVAGYHEWSAFGNESFLDPIKGIGAGGYAVIGLAALFAGLPYLTNLFSGGDIGTVWSGGSAGFVNWAAGIEVAAAMVILFSEFLEEYIVPIASGG
jgi:multicomponent Na+:H+ antiporter subunit B